ncbi:hypothetical protein [Rufibacter sp. XAAS-G3-1]|uniref:hypothetical protein n=1 Tax=Rufibacter sp. XAAS-G3-1 TaxID=2729134 RepID=UPI0015E6AB86|nr:hypothetical protein [Rufibacter sp. XAAS-G3-1]
MRFSRYGTELLFPTSWAKYKKGKIRILVLEFKESTMNTRTVSIGSILSQIKQLNHSDRINILEKVVSLIKKESVDKKRVSLSSISGLGSEIWTETDIDKYIENERQWD